VYILYILLFSCIFFILRLTPKADAFAKKMHYRVTMHAKSSPTSKANELGFLHVRRETSQKWLTSLMRGNTVQ
jgi:hypothetical protein